MLKAYNNLAKAFDRAEENHPIVMDTLGILLIVLISVSLAVIGTVSRGF